MPYIKQEKREFYRPEIDDLVEKLTNFSSPKHIVSVGELNYVFSKILWTIFDQNPSYTLGNNLTGCLECVKQEFYRRRLSLLEEKKMLDNGDLIIP
jgi:hypothetical protein